MRILRRARDIDVRERIRETDNLVLLLIGLGLGLLLWFALPQILPRVRSGPDCTSLSAPAGGNQRSILAVADENQDLGIDVRVSGNQLNQGEPLEANVILTNRSRGSIILYIPEAQDQPVLSGAQPGVGVNLRILNVQTRQEIYAVAPPPVITGGTIDPRNLYLLPAHERCSVKFEFTSAELGNFGLPGEYRLEGIYVNNNPGIIPTPFGGAFPTATPAFQNQGVWAEPPARSEEVLLLIVQPPPPTTAPVTQ